MKLYFVFLLLLLGISFTVVSHSNAQGVGSSAIDINAIVEGCGDLIIETPEECDGPDLGGFTCTSLGRRAARCTRCRKPSVKK